MAKPRMQIAPQPPAEPTSLALTGQDADEVEALRVSVCRHLENLGALREESLRTEARIFQELSKARQDLNALVGMIGKRAGLELDGGQWAFDAKAKVFSRRMGG